MQKEDIRFHYVRVDNERDAQAVQRVVSAYLRKKSIQAEIEVYPFDGEWVVEFQSGERPKFGDILEQVIENANIHWSGGGFAVNGNMRKSWREDSIG